MLQGLTESEREALVIRWRRILILGLIDFFNGTNNFGKLIVKELVDMREAIIKAFAKSLGIPLHSGGSWRRFNDILSDIYRRKISDLPKETVIRVWRMFYKLVATIDPDFSIIQETEQKHVISIFYRISSRKLYWRET